MLQLVSKAIKSRKTCQSILLSMSKDDNSPRAEREENKCMPVQEMNTTMKKVCWKMLLVYRGALISTGALWLTFKHAITAMLIKD